jgi:hypothetical protein
MNYLPSSAQVISAEQAIYTFPIDQCLSCGSSGCPENFLFCIDCGECAHSYCIDVSFVGISDSIKLTWRCLNCKVCDIPSCEVSNDSPEWPRMIICDLCDRSYHLCCLKPPINDFPEGSWFCYRCDESSYCIKCKPDYLLSDEEVRHRSAGILIDDLVTCVEIRSTGRFEKKPSLENEVFCARCAVQSRYR